MGNFFKNVLRLVSAILGGGAMYSATPYTLLVDPPGLTARSGTPCRAPRTPAHSTEGTLRPCGHCAKRLSHSVLGSNCLLSGCFNGRIGQLRCLQTHLGVSFPLHAMPCPHTPAFSFGRHCTCVRDTAQQWIIHYLAR